MGPCRIRRLVVHLKAALREVVVHYCYLLSFGSAVVGYIQAFAASWVLVRYSWGLKDPLNPSKN